MFDINVGGTRHVVNTCLQLGIPRIVHISSVAALGRKPGEPIRESDPWTGQYANNYSESKHEAEMEIFRGAEEGITVSVVNPSLIMSGLPLHRSSGMLFDHVWRQRSFYTKGHINYVDVRDVADAVSSLTESPRPGERFTLCGGRMLFSEFFGEVARRWNRKAPSIAVPTGVAYLMGAAEEVRCLLTGREPLVTRQTASLASHSFRYDTSRSTGLPGLRYRSISDTLDWCCTVYEQHVNRNK
jgi:nucleoside-diphosphate-sugar epimerase